MSNTVNVSTTTNQVVITPQSAKTVSINSGGDTSITVNQGGSNTVNISNNIVNTSLTPTTVDITTPPSNGITVTDLRKTITVNQGITSTVQVASIGPQGPKGDTGATGPQGPQGPVQDTGSLLTTASYSNPNLTFTKGNGDTFDVEIETTSIDTGSFIITASSNNSATISYTKGDGSQFFNIIDRVSSASYAQSASYVEEAQNNVEIIAYNNTTFNITAIKTNGEIQTAKINNVPSSSYVSSSGNIIADSITLSTSSVQDTYMMGFPRTTDGIAGRSSYFLSFDNTSTALKNSNFGATNFPISASDYYNRVIPCDDMTIADGKSIDITGMLIVSGADNINSRQVQIDLYTASITPNNTTNPSDPLNFTRAFQGNNIALDVSSPFNSIHHFTQSFDISTLPTDSLIAVALSNDSATTAVTTDTNVSISLRLTRNYKKKN